MEGSPPPIQVINDRTGRGVRPTSLDEKAAVAAAVAEFNLDGGRRLTASFA